MFYMYRVTDSGVIVRSATGLTLAEVQAGRADGWVFYMTTDRTAQIDADRIAAGHDTYGMVIS